MELATFQGLLKREIDAHLAQVQRYRVLVLQSCELATLRMIHSVAPTMLKWMNAGPITIDARSLIDDSGALSCSAALERVIGKAEDCYVLLAGPLNFLDYWSPQTSLVFWRTLATFESGPGILVTDTPRDSSTHTLFRAASRIPGTDVRCLRSRLAATEGRVR